MPVVRISDEVFRELQRRAQPLVDDIDSVLRRILGIATGQTAVTTRRSRSQATGDLTPQKVFDRPILETLVEMGGRASGKRVTETVGSKMRSLLRPGDNERNRDGVIKWVKAVQFRRLKMVHEGLIAGNSPRGIWEITDKGRQWLAAR